MKQWMNAGVVALVATCAIVSSPSAKENAWRTGGWLGARTQSVELSSAQARKLDRDFNIVIEEITPSSPAASAGLRHGDIILALNGKSIVSDDDLVDMVSDADAGEIIKLTIIRDEKQTIVPVKLGSRRDAPESDQYWEETDHGVRGIPNVRFYTADDAGTAYLGISMLHMSGQLAENFGTPYGEGALINDVVKNSPAAKAGLRAGDIILSLDGDKVRDEREVSEIISEMDAGESVKVEVLRKNTKMCMTATLGNQSAQTDNLTVIGFDAADLSPMPYEIARAAYAPRALYSTGDVNLDPDEMKAELDKLRKEVQTLREQVAKLKK